jgi:tol-pal system protein YbgF
MFSNLQRVLVLTLLASAASSSFAAPAPVSDLSGSNSTSSSAVGSDASQSRLERLIESRNQMQLQMQQQLDQMAADIQNLRGLVERNSYDIDQAVQRQRELFIEVDNLRSSLNGKTAAPAATAAPVEENAAQGTYSENADEQTAYQNAVDLILKKRDYTGAIDAFNQFRKQFPDSSFTPNAHYWLGQLYFAKKQYGDAKTSFESVVAFKDSNKRADALVKLGDIAKRDQKTTEANQYYQQVIDQYPSSSSAKEAKQSMVK